MPKVLFLSANPFVEQKFLRLDDEVLGVKARLDAAPSHQIEVSRFERVQASQVQLLISKEKADIVHFAGHGTVDGALLFENEERKSKPMGATELADIFRAVRSDKPRCVVFNSCYSEALARPVSRHIEFVVGMTGEHPDHSAIGFAAGFYFALACNRSLADAVELGRLEAAIAYKAGSSPKLLKRRGADPTRATFSGQCELRAEFILDEKQRPCQKKNGEFALLIYVHNAPPTAFSTVYQINHRTFPKPFKEIARDQSGRFDRETSSYGDVEVRATIWCSKESIATRSLLSEALRRHYGPDPELGVRAAIDELAND